MPKVGQKAAPPLPPERFHLVPLDNPAAPECLGAHPKDYDRALCDRPNAHGKIERGKHPIGAWQTDATDSAAKVSSWRKRGYNLAVACGPSGVGVLDEDMPGEVERFCRDNGVEMPETYRVRTGRGHHYYFAVPDGVRITNYNPFKAAGYDIDVRGAGGYVVAAGSVHATGVVYEAEDEDMPAADMPDWLVRFLTTPPVAHGGGARPAKPSLSELLAAPPVRGQELTNDWLTAVAGHLAARHRGDFETYASEVKRAAALVDPDYEDIAKVTDSVWKTDRTNHPGEGPLHSWDDVPPATLDESTLDPATNVRDILAGTEQFWAARPVLGHIRQAARARLVSPWAVLVGSVVRALAAVPPYVYLPPIIGGRASLNTFTCVVAPSGGGKDASGDVARDLLVIQADTQVQEDALGSGEGLTRAYAHRDRNGNLVMDYTNVLFTVSEIDNLTALSSRQGSTLMGSLRAGWTGGRLGFGYGDPTKKVILEPHSYRMCLVVLAQPGRAASLFGDADGGTPQRFIWIPGFGGLDVSNAQDIPPWPGEIEIGLPWRFEDEYLEPKVELTVPDVARDLIIQTRIEMVGSGATSLDGHALLARLKFAYGLALIDGRAEMNDEDWLLAGVVMQVSDRTRDWMQSEVEKSQRAEAAKRGQLRAAQDDAAQAEAERARTHRISGLVEKHLAAGPLAQGVLKRKLASRDKPFFDGVLDLLVRLGRVVPEEAAHGGTRYRLGGAK
ncbi:bifunctional DNA primase/polymerase [Microbacterium sp. AZCO]|uniref:bifunctional DNA primase/polymerase n=1 Tax=Microbacterium sp. AZCO TaxID=3142976 RepID=UPI0031F47573